MSLEHLLPSRTSKKDNWLILSACGGQISLSIIWISVEPAEFSVKIWEIRPFKFLRFLWFRRGIPVWTNFYVGFLRKSRNLPTCVFFCFLFLRERNKISVLGVLRGVMFYGAVVWDPWMIVAQIVCLQCLYYLTLGLFLGILVGTRVSRLSLVYFFDYATLTASTVTGWCVIISFILSSLAG